jgi:tripartite-type tricarboxylate transporter receptor subunit TctC
MLFGAISAIIMNFCVINAFSASYPDKPIHLVAHSKPGSGMDTILRNLGNAMDKALPVPTVVENKPGGGAAIATTYVATSNQPGYYLLGTTNTHTITPLTADTPHSLKDLKPVCRLVIDPLVIVTT